MGQLTSILTTLPAELLMTVRTSLLPLVLVSLGLSTTALAQGATASTATVGRYSADQATRGEATYKRACAECHSIRDHANPDFRFSWNGRTALELFENIRNTMPEENPGSLTRQEYADIVAYMMKMNGMPSGPRPLAPDSTSLRAARLDVRDARSR
jgi:mono/diheme cytochrome c family protein